LFILVVAAVLGMRETYLNDRFPDSNLDYSTSRRRRVPTSPAKLVTCGTMLDGSGATFISQRFWSTRVQPKIRSAGHVELSLGNLPLGSLRNFSGLSSNHVSER
jgi:hypothetical protein